MRQRLADFDVDLVSAERPKFASPIVFLHGLWTGPWIWRSFAGYLAHRGWSSYHVAWHATARSIAELSSGLQRALKAIDVPAVIIGHDIGATVALPVQEARAIIALAPLPIGDAARRLPLFSGARAQWSRWRRGTVLPNRRQAEGILGVIAPDALVPEPWDWIDDLASQPPLSAASAGRPLLIAVGGEDRFVKTADTEALARASHAEILTYPEASHALPLAAGWEQRVSDVHRWLVRRLGASLLLLRGDEDLEEE